MIRFKSLYKTRRAKGRRLVNVSRETFTNLLDKMKFGRNSYHGRMMVIGFALIIGLSSLMFTNYLARQLRQKEQNEVSLWAYAMSRGGVNTDDPMLQFIVSSNNKIPFVIIDENMAVIRHNLIPDKIINNNELLFAKLDQLSQVNPRIEIPDWGNTFYLFYDDSAILKSIYYYPYIQLSIIIIFVLVTYIAFKSSKRDEQNRVWIGMAKETAHQLGTPTSSLLGWIEYLRTQPVDSFVVDEMNKDLTRLLKIVDRFSKIGSATSLAEGDVTVLVDNCVQYFRTRIPKNVELRFDPPKAPFMAMVNVALFEWVVENLLKNALDALQGKGEIVVSMTQDEKTMQIDVHDTGKGMPKSNFKRIFSPGFTTKTRGWGLGLSLSRRIIVEYHKGRIFVANSEINVGTTMRIVLQKI